LIAFTGILSDQKDPALWNLIATSNSDIARNAGYSFCWVGDGPLVHEIDKNHVTITGWKNAAEVQELLEKTAVYFSSAAWEGLPYGVLEAMNNECALLLRDIPGNRELVVIGENGWLYSTKEEAYEKLSLMLKDKPKLISMGKRSREIVEQSFSLKQMGEGYRKIFFEMQEKIK
jgi:glycosyltransferase involved in cell wall biosynthesis